MFDWVRRVNLLWFFFFFARFSYASLLCTRHSQLVLLSFLTASVVDTLILGALQFLLFGIRGRQRGK
ncbi:hypothetical protein SD71_00660 [Cohnella kolymensis]|uniref:Secreted peptide n=1 Tax=Cohnella kolymensis TaxID=1590652 RepID=A0ABR5A870_9BACL|nr:hypothetical protein SD71_00660 [Cohnella kolymensis]